MSEYQVERNGYRLPEIPRIGSGATKLYAAEKRAHKAIEAASLAMLELFKKNCDGNWDLWKDIMPEILAGLLDQYETGAAEAAAIGFLTKKGYGVCDRAQKGYEKREQEATEG